LRFIAFVGGARVLVVAEAFTGDTAWAGDKLSKTSDVDITGINSADITVIAVCWSARTTDAVGTKVAYCAGVTVIADAFER
jgi:hypothetical protein